MHLRLGLTSLLTLGLFGCGTTPCEEAIDKAKECGYSEATLSDTGRECGPYAECVAGCIVNGSCNDVMATIGGDTDNAVYACGLECGE